jgi:tetratricopeptide (TPR) repeat protein
MARIACGRFFGGVALIAAGMLAHPSYAQTMQQLRTCQGKEASDLASIIRACSIFIETDHAVGGRPLPKQARGGMLELRANAYTKKGEQDLAIADYNSAIRLNIKKYEYEFYLNRGNNYFNKKDYERANADYDESIRQNPKFPLAYVNRGNVYTVQGDYGRANADYAEALRIDPKNAATLRAIQSAKLFSKMDATWIRYLQEIQDDRDYANWSGPPVEIFRNAK